MCLVYRLILPAEDVNLLYPRLQESDAYLEFATLGTPETGLLPQFWAYGADRDWLANQLNTTPALRAISKQTVCADRVRYEVQWETDMKAVSALDRFRARLCDSEITVLFGRISPAEWVCVLQVLSQRAAIRCYTECEYPDCRLARYSDLDLETHHPDGDHTQ